tara:strand:+ start:206 stop:601 length:396 start_codon:yes stop_codon:yes gene_type:complete
MYLVYILKSDNLSYVGMTNDFLKRFRQHNGEIVGGAKYTKKKDFWYPVCIIDGFKDRRAACQCEWRLKRGKNGPQGRINYLSNYLSMNQKWTQKSDNILSQNLTFYIDENFITHFYKSNHNFSSKELYWKE